MRLAWIPLLVLVGCASLPEGTRVRIEPSEPGVDDELLAVLDGDVGALGQVTWNWSWTRDGELTEFTGTRVPAEATDSGEVWRVVTFAVAGSARGEPIDDQVVIEGDPGGGGGGGTGGDVSLSPVEPTTRDDITARLADPGDQIWTWSWQISGNTVSETSSTLPASATSKGQRIVAIATPEIGEPLRSASIEVVNSPPTAPEVRITPDDPLTDDLLRCSIFNTSSDADGDAVAYRVAWSVDGTGFTGRTQQTTWPGDTVPAGELAGGQVWTCSATASDGEDDSEASPAAASVTVVAPGKLVPGHTRLEAELDGFSTRCIEWRGDTCTHMQVKLACAACSDYPDCNVWHDTTRFNDEADGRTPRNLCAVATGSPDVIEVGGGGGASAPAACGYFDTQHPVCTTSRATFHAGGFGIPSGLGLMLNPAYCDEDPTLIHVNCAGW